MSLDPKQNQPPSVDQPTQPAVLIAQPAPKTPALTLPVVPIREGVLFPSTESILTFGRSISLNAIQDVDEKNNMVVLITQKKPNLNSPTAKDLYTVGTLALVERKIKTGESINALVRGIGRVKIIKYLNFAPKIIAEVESLPDQYTDQTEVKAMATHLQKIFRQAVHMGKPVEFLSFMKLMSGVTDGELTDQIASTLNIGTQEKQDILETVLVKKRIQLVTEKLSHEIKVLEIEKDVVNKTQKKFDKNMKENILRERLRTIQKELGEIEDEEEILDEYNSKLKKTQFPKEVAVKIKKEIKRLKQMSPNNPESGYVRTWLDTIFELPWGKNDPTTVNLKLAQKILHKSHYGLDEVKDRVIEYIAVLQLKQKNEEKTEQKLPTILCFVGPPGVGKTSIGKSIAECLKRKFVKISLGGIRDEAEIRGHRRTYVGAMAGRIINGIKQAGSMNPVFMLDEIDKLGNDFRGDPSSALLEALDPEQNSEFEDHYLDVKFDLSQVIFITTANTLDTIPPALKDRLEIIRYSGYTEEEKLRIASGYLVKKVIKANGLKTNQLDFKTTALEKIIARYTRESGVREIERKLHQITRKIARKLVESGKLKTKTQVTTKTVREILGPEIFDREMATVSDTVGQATGLAWTSVGGDTLFIEVALTAGKGEIKLTGKLGEVMKESAQAALTYVKANASRFGINVTNLQKTDVHIHVPEGAVPKDGPSAGVTITTAVVSAFTKIPVKKNVAMTGEVTLRGRVLRIGGLKEKSIAAATAGISVIIIPEGNKRDLEKIPTSVKKIIKFIGVNHVDQVIAQALKKTPKTFQTAVQKT